MKANITTEFARATQKKKSLADFISEQRLLATEVVCLRRRLINPVNLKSGGSLSESTINGYKRRISIIKDQFNCRKAVFKLLKLCGYLKRKPDGLTQDQEILVAFLRDYTKKCREIRRLKEKNNDYLLLNHSLRNEAARYKVEVEHEKLMRQADEAMRRADDTMRKADKVMQETKGLFSELRESAETKAKVYPFKIIDGGMKVEEQPPFVNP